VNIIETERERETFDQWSKEEEKKIEFLKREVIAFYSN
jgi:hypothetical protein